MRVHIHGRRGAVVAAVSAAAVLCLGLVAQAGLGSTSATQPTATQTPAGGNGDNNVAVAVGKDGKSVWAIRLKVVMVNDPVVDAANAAVAAASCTDCQTVAIAIEGVLVTGDAEVVEPVNIALALNTECTSCQTLAAAYQSVVGTDGRVRITGDGRRRIAQLRQQLHDLRRSGLPLDQIAAEVDRIAAEFTAVLRTEVFPIGRTDGGPTGGAAAQGSGAPAPSSSSSPQPSASPSSEPSGTPTPTSTPTAGSTP